MTSATGRRGFSLIELLVVISIIALLAGMTLSGIMRSKETTVRANTKIMMDNIKRALLAYNTDCGELPVDNFRASAGSVPGEVVDNWVYTLMRRGKTPPYLEGMDDQNLELGAGTGKIFDPWGSPIQYRVVGLAASYRDYKKIAAVFQQAFFLWSNGPDGVDQMTAGYGSAWDTAASDWQTFNKLKDPQMWMEDNHGDDVVVGN